MGQFFLAGDSNDSVGQFVEERSLSPLAIAAWSETFNKFSTWRDAYALDKISLLVAPAKEEIFPDLYPYTRAKRTVFDDFIGNFRNCDMINPKWELRAKRDFTYRRTDTHWSDFGATVAALATLKSWGFSGTGLPETFCVVQRIGDLGNKLEPHVASWDLCFPADICKRQIFDNGIANQGNIRVLRNPAAPRDERLMIFGDSFGTNLALAFSGAFTEVYFTYQPAGFDPEFVQIVKPRHVLLEITQRFLHGQPATGRSVFSQGKEKLAAMDKAAKDLLKARLAREPSEFAPLFSSLMEA